MSHQHVRAQHGADVRDRLVRHRPILMDATTFRRSPSRALATMCLHPGGLDPQLEDAARLFPCGRTRSGVKLAIKLLSAHADGNPILAETSEVKGLLVAAAIWIKERRDRKTMPVDDNGEPEIDPHGTELRRFLRHTGPSSTRARPARLQQTYGIATRASSGPRTGRAAVTFLRAREGARRRVLRGRRWDRPYWYGHERCSRVGVASCAAAEWESRWWRRSSTPSTGDARRGRHGHLSGSRSSTSPAPVARLSLAPVREQGRRRPGRTVYTPLLNAPRHPRRPDHHAACPTIGSGS